MIPRVDQQASVSNLDGSSDILCVRAAESAAAGNGSGPGFSTQSPAAQPPSIVVHRAEIEMLRVRALEWSV